VDRFDNMRVFAKVVESGSFTGAAARLSISASMVSQHVKELEERLGARLLNRTTRKVSLTETGRAYYERCTRLLADLEETEQAVSDMHAIPRGELRVNAAPTFGIVQLAPAIADFTARFPAISVELMLSIRIADLIDEGSMSPCGSESFRTRVLSRANSRPAAWSSAARRAISRSTARHGHPTISRPTIASRLL
jgi:DNA-binding transcriptional LysR family regulator